MVSGVWSVVKKDSACGFICRSAEPGGGRRSGCRYIQYSPANGMLDKSADDGARLRLAREGGGIVSGACGRDSVVRMTPEKCPPSTGPLGCGNLILVTTYLFPPLSSE